MGAHKRGINNMKQAIKYSGADSRLLKKLGRLCMKDGQKQEGIKYLKQALRYDRNDLDTLKLIGLANLDLGNYGIAKNWFIKSLIRIKNHTRLTSSWLNWRSAWANLKRPRSG